jgi:chromosome segregation ATPase
MPNSKLRRARALAIATALWLALPSLASAQSADVVRLRDALRDATAELRALQDQTSSLTTQKDQAVKERDDLRAQLKDATDKLAAAKGQVGHAAVDRAEGGDRSDALARQTEQQLRASQDELAKVRDTLAKWKEAYNEAAGVAKAQASQNKLAQQERDGAQQQLASCVEKNRTLLRLGNEALDLYQNKDFIDALKQEDPVLQLKRAEIENVIQDAQDHLLEQKVRVSPASQAQ